jgi:Asp-tRNA(Asn)/Glu-tRNA(Gln) amidotransferase C subunit
MAIGEEITQEQFLEMAKAAGLDTSSLHMEELFPIVRATLRGLGSINQLDLSNVEPDMIYRPNAE